MMLSPQTRLVVQGSTGHQGTYHTQAMREFGTNIVAGVTPRRGGERVHGVPVFDSVGEAVRHGDPNASIIFVPAPRTRDAVLESLDAGIPFIVVVSEHVPVHDAIDFIQYARVKKARIVGPNCPGVAVPGIAKVGIMPNMIFKKGRTAVISRSGTLTYEIVNSLSEAGVGQSFCLGIGGDPVIGTSFEEALVMLKDDAHTDSVVMIGEIGGTAEEEAAHLIRKFGKPVIAYIAGRTAPPEKRMGHAGAIITRGRGTAESKIAALREAGAHVALTPSEVPKLLANEGF